MDRDLSLTTIPFVLRGQAGTVKVRYGANHDPAGWGYEVLELDWYRPERVRGFPVIEASVQHPAEGYAANMGWVQVVRYRVRDPGEEEERTVFDVPPQLSETDVPYLAFGIKPTAFDAPAIGANDVDWEADTFLVHTPDAVLTRVLRAVCGFTWGYRVRDGVPALRPLRRLGTETWQRNLVDLRERFSTWTFEDVSSW